jgi:hypothetical protein
MRNQQKNSREEFEKSIIQRACDDREFRAQLVADCTGTLRSLGVELPPGVELQVLEETPSRFYVVLPATDELSDNELRQVAGGIIGDSGIAPRTQKETWDDFFVSTASSLNVRSSPTGMTGF